MQNAMNLSETKTLAVFNNAAIVDGTSAIDNTIDLQLGCCDYWPYYQTYHYYWPLPQVIALNKTETAFKVVKVLIDKKLAKIQTVKQFVELMDAVVSVL